MHITRDITFELTLKCNLSCNMCSRQFLADKSSSLDFALIEKVLDDLASPGCEDFRFSFGGYGEPLSYPRLLDAIRLVKSRMPDSPLTITTNGHLLTAAMADRLLDSGLDYLRVSLNATTSEEYRRLMNSERHAVVEANLRRLLERKRETGVKMKVGIQILDTIVNKANYADYKSAWLPLFSDNDFMTYRFMENRGGTIDSTSLSSGSSPGHLANRWPCFALWRYLAIDTLGRVYCCCEAYTFREQPTLLLLGSLDQTSILEIIDSAQLKEVREMHLRNDYSRIPECAHCTKPLNYPNVWRLEGENWEWREEAPTPSSIDSPAMTD